MKQVTWDKVKEYAIGISIFFVIVLVFYLYMFKNFSMIFGINDDWTVYMVLSGSYLGEPNPYVLFFLYPLAWVICKLYSITTEIPWYGLLLHGCFILSSFWIFIRCYTRLKTKKILSACVLVLVFLFSNIRILTAIQYTHSAAVCGASAIFCYITSDTKNKDWKGCLWANVPTIIMAALALCIRKNAAFMCLPVAGMIFLAKCAVEDKKVSLELAKKYSATIATLFGVLGGLLLIHQVAYSSDIWSEYADINYYREKVVDFYGVPSYNEMKDVVDSIGMTEEEYYLRNQILPFYNADIPYSEFWKISMERSKEKYDAEHPIRVRFIEANDSIIQALEDEYIVPQNYIFIILLLGIVVWLILEKKWEGIILLAFYIFGRLFAWYYILFNGRFPIRIPQCLYVIDILSILGILIYLYSEKRNYFNKKSIVIWSLSLILVFFACTTGIKETKNMQGYVYSYQDRWYGIKKYCMQHPDNMYMLNDGSQTLYYYSDNVLDTNTIGKLQNYIAISNFYSMSSNCFEKLGISPGGNMAEEILEGEQYYWIYETGCFGEHLNIVQYYKKKYDSFVYEMVDVFETETTSYEVYRFSK